jgi:hypothetical protein
MAFIRGKKRGGIGLEISVFVYYDMFMVCPRPIELFEAACLLD